MFKIPDNWSAADARGYAAELNYSIANPEEEELTEDSVKDMKRQLQEIREFLISKDEAL